MSSDGIDQDDASRLAATSLDNARSTTMQGSRVLWWIQVAQVRLRFVVAIAVAGLVVTQWTTVRNVWDRWIWHPTGISASAQISGGHEYFCPMDPGVLSAWPAICPICNMDLVPRRKADAQQMPAGVIARMQFSPWRVQLAGVRTSPVALQPLTLQIRLTGVLDNNEDALPGVSGLGYSAHVAAEDAVFFRTEQPVTVRLPGAAKTLTGTATLIIDSGPPPIVRVTLDADTALVRGMVVTSTAAINIGAVLAADGEAAAVTDSTTGSVLSIPATAVVDRGDERIVYVESMPGMFDGVAVQLGRRTGGNFPVIRGLEAGQQVVTSGAFLIDAEARLNPGLATGYFGASQPALSSATSTAPLVPTRTKPATAELSEEDLSLIEQQKICPVTDLPLDSMGGPVPVLIGTRKVFLCCAACEKKLRGDPDTYLAKIPQSADRGGQ